MNKRAVAVLGVITALLLAYVLVFERDSVTSKELADRKGRVLPSFVRDKVERLEIERRNKRVVLERKPAKEGELRSFVMLEPVRSDADADAVDQVLGELEWLSARRTLDPLSAEDAKRFGLEAPRYRVAFVLGRERHVLEVGSDDVHGESVYARVDRAPRAVVVPKTLLDVLNREPGAFREKQLFRELTVAWARKVSLSSDTSAFELQKQDERWWLAAEPRGLADDARVDELLRGLAELRATRYLEPEQLAAASADLEKPHARVTVTVVPEETREDKKPVELALAVGGACPDHKDERIARVLPDGAPVCIRESDAKQLERKPDAFRDLRLFAAEPTAVQFVELTRDGRRQALRRGDQGWRFDDGAVRDAGTSLGTGADAGAASSGPDREAVEAWLTELSRVRAQRIVPRSKLEARDHLALVSVGEKAERIELALGPQGELIARRKGEALELVFSERVGALLRVDPQRFRPLSIWSTHQPSEVRRIEARDDRRHRVLVLQAGEWMNASSAPSDAPVQSGRIRELVRALLDLKALLTLGEKAPVGVDFARGPSVRIGLADERILSLEVGGATDAGAYARVNGTYIVEIARSSLGILAELAGGPRAELEAPAPPSTHGEHDEDDEHEHTH